MMRTLAAALSTLLLLALGPAVRAQTPASAAPAGPVCPWQACEDPGLWIPSPLWAPGSPRFSREEKEKREGAAAVRVDYTARQNGSYAVGISPRLDEPVDVRGFSSLSLAVYHPEPARMRLRIVVRDSHQQRVVLQPVAGYADAESINGESCLLPAGPGWSTVCFSWRAAADPIDDEIFGEKAPLADIAAMAIVLTVDGKTEGAGYALIDNVLFLPAAALAPAGNARYPARFRPEDPRTPEFHRLLSRVRERVQAGDLLGSSGELKQILELSPNNEVAAKYLQRLYTQAAPARRATLLAFLKAKSAAGQSDREKSAAYRRVYAAIARMQPDSPAPVVIESARDIPVIASVDVVVAGGSSAAVAAAESAARSGARVFLVSEQSYLGFDLAGTLDTWLDPGEKPQTDLSARLFSNPAAAPGTSGAGSPSPAESAASPVVAGSAQEPTPSAPTEGAPPAAGTPLLATPLKIKRTLDETLLAAGVDFLYSCYAADLLLDGSGKPAGIVIANRSGRQAILARTVIDATERATLARKAGASFSAFHLGAQKVRWVTINAAEPSGSGESVVRLPLPVEVWNKNGQKRDERRVGNWYLHTLTGDLLDGSWSAQAWLEQEVRDEAFRPGQLYSPDAPLLVPPVAILGTAPAGKPGSGEDPLALGVFRPKGVERLWVLSGCADVARTQAADLLRPLPLLEAGARVGVAAAAEAARLAVPTRIRVAGGMARPILPGEVKEALAGLRPAAHRAVVHEAARALPVLGSYDVVVVGGGTSGAPAGIGAARQGARTLVLEYLHGLGGVGTFGMIGGFWYGNRVGFTKTVPEGPTDERMEWYRRQLRAAGADVWFGVTGCGALMQGGKVTGVVVATPHGRGVVRARVVIDATGNAEIARAAGARTAYVEDDLVVQASHFPPRQVGSWYINGDIPAVDVSDPINTRAVFLTRPRFRDSFDSSPFIGSRERQRVVGDYMLDWLDIINRRTFTDSIVLARSDYDSHGEQIHPFFALRPARIPGDYSHQFSGYTPYRCLLPQGIEGMLVVGLGVSAHRDALPIIRMQPDLGNQGYAAGVAAAMAAAGGVAPRRIDIKALQRHLVRVGNLPESVLTDTDSFPLPAARVAEAVVNVKKQFADLEVLMASPQTALPLLRQALQSATGPDALHYAEVLGVMGDPAGVPVLLAEAERRIQALELEAFSKEQPDELTRLIWALGYSRDRRAVPVLASLVGAIAPTDWARYRAAVVSLGRFGDPAAAPTLARLVDYNVKEPGRRELFAACALYRCGDPTGAARALLIRAAQDPSGPVARFAQQILASKPGALTDWSR